MRCEVACVTSYLSWLKLGVQLIPAKKIGAEPCGNLKSLYGGELDSTQLCALQLRLYRVAALYIDIAINKKN